MFCCAYMYSVCDIVLCLPHIHQTMIEVVDISEYNTIMQYKTIFKTLKIPCNGKFLLV